MALIESVALQSGYDNFCLLLDKDIEIEPRLATARHLLSYGRSPVEPDFKEWICRFLERGPETFRTLKVMATRSREKEALQALCQQGAICFDWQLPFNNEALLSPPGKPFNPLRFADVIHFDWRRRLLERLDLDRRQAFELGVASRGRYIAINCPTP